MRGRRSVVAGLAVAALVLVAAAIGRFAPTSPKKPNADIGTTLDQALPSWATSMVFTDDFGKHTTLADFSGKTVVLVPFMTLCQETCPLTTTNLMTVDKSVLNAHQENNVQIVEITIDPERDTVARLDAYRGVAEIRQPNWSLLTAAPADLSRLWKLLGVDVEKTAPAPGAVDWLGGKPLTYDLTHTDEVFFLDKTGHERFLIDGAPNTKGVLPSPVLDKFLNDDGQANLTNPDASTWTADDATTSLAWVLGKHLKSP
jgi:cytochrome oxidase Cu insertion factor (SCO1/SenC/PrrC family)